MLQVSALGAHLNFGAVVRNLTPDDLLAPQTVAELKELWIAQGLILFNDTVNTPQFQIDLSRCFGPLIRHPVRELWVDDHPELISLISRPEAGSIVSIDGKEVAGWIPWHSDTIYVPQINHGGILRVIQSTSWGGETGFIDRIDAYERLPSRLKEVLEGREIVYQLQPLDASPIAKRMNAKVVRSRASTKAVSSRAKEDFPPVAHPAIFVQPETGRRVLNISPHFSQYILGIPRDESDAILNDLIDHISSCPSYMHTWRQGDMILWDNWRMVHCVTGAPVDEVRIMQRTTIGGDYGLGRTLANEPLQ